MFEGAGNFNQATPVVVGGTLYFTAWDGYVYALDAGSGALKWKFNAWEGIQPNPPGETRPDINIDPLGEMRGGVAYGDGRIFFGAGTGRVHCLMPTRAEKFGTLSSILNRAPPGPE